MSKIKPRLAQAVRFIDGAIAAGKPIKSVRSQMIAQYIGYPREVRALVNGLPSIHEPWRRAA